jgi:RNA polymerase sigma-54 factor
MGFIKAGIKTKTVSRHAVETSSSLEMSEDECGSLIDDIKKTRYFKIMINSGIIRNKSSKFFTHSYLKEYSLKDDSKNDYTSLMDDTNPVVSKIKKIGIEKFSKYFLSDKFDENDISKECGISEKEVSDILKFIDRYYLFESQDNILTKKAYKTYSTVAKIEVKNKKIKIVFITENIWKERYVINKTLLNRFMPDLKTSEKKKVNEIINKIENIEYRKNVMYNLLKLITEVQSEYIISGDEKKLKPVSQVLISKKINCHPSTINRVVNSKSIILPSNIEIPIKHLITNNKYINRIRLKEILSSTHNLSDRKLSEVFFNRYGVNLSTRTVNSYRKDILNRGH